MNKKMSESKHTPGPWLLAERTVYALNDKGINLFSALVQDAHAPAYELEANVRLIAVAPELLEFVEEWLRRQGGDDNYMTAKAKAVIAKAKGE